MNAELPSLPDVSNAVPLYRADEVMLSEITSVLKKHGALNRIGLVLLHQHFPTTDKETLLESTDIEARCQKIQVSALAKVLQDPEVIPTSWRLTEDAKPLAMTYCQPREHYRT